MIDNKFPLIDLHRHIEGSIRIETILDLAQFHRLPLPADDIQSLRPFIQVFNPQPGVMAFIEKIKLAASVLADYSACQRVAYENVLDADEEGLDYVELRFSPWFMAEAHELDPTRVVDAVINGVNQAQSERNIKVKLIGILSRTYGPDIAHRELSAFIEHKEFISGLDLAGDEAAFPGELFIDHIKIARQSGWMITIHAGESAGPESVRQAIQELGANRIGHGVRAVEDPGLMEMIAERGIGIETNLTSNVQTSTVKDYASHPLRRFLELGITATINTDDPVISRIDLQHEYDIASPAAGLSIEQAQQAQRNALKVAFLSENEKEEIMQPYVQDKSS